MLTNSRDIVRRLEQEGWTLVRVTGSHHVFKNPVSGETVVVPHPRMEARLRFDVSHYIAIIEDAGPDHAVGVWFPDLPGGTSAGEDIDEALRNAPEALELYADSLEADGKPLPRPRTLTELRGDPEVADDIKSYVVALIELPARAHAAE